MGCFHPQTILNRHRHLGVASPWGLQALHVVAIEDLGQRTPLCCPSEGAVGFLLDVSSPRRKKRIDISFSNSARRTPSSACPAICSTFRQLVPCCGCAPGQCLVLACKPPWVVDPKRFGSYFKCDMHRSEQQSLQLQSSVPNHPDDPVNHQYLLGRSLQAYKGHLDTGYDGISKYVTEMVGQGTVRTSHILMPVVFLALPKIARQSISSWGGLSLATLPLRAEHALKAKALLGF